MSIYTDKNYDDSCEGSRDKRKRLASPDEHIMNKDEGKVMRRLQNDTGLTEKEIRLVKKYRIMLSAAQVAGTKCKRGRVEKVRDEVMKSICSELKLPKGHPDVEKAYRKEWKRRAAWPCVWGNIYSRNTPYRNQGEKLT